MKRLSWWILLFVAAGIAIAVVTIPTFYIQPFKPQAAEGLARAYALRQAAPAVTAVALPVVVVSALALVWLGTLRVSRRPESPRHSSRRTEVLRHVPSAVRSPVGQDFSPAEARRRTDILRRVGRFLPPVFRGLALVVLVGLTALVTWFCRQNHFEWMFAPPAEVKYVSAKDAARFLTGDEMVMGIEVAGLSLAYPVRQMAYHHLVNDMFGTIPVVVTY